MATEKSSLVDHRRSDLVTLNVHASKKQAKPVSKCLFGKFTEHLGRNIYHGMWAQILENPSFEPSNFFGKNESALEKRLGRMEQEFPTLNLRESFREGIAYLWAKYGEGDVSYSVVPDSVGAWSSQRIEISSLKTREVGIQQPAFLPLHREDIYEVSLWLKGDAERLILAVETLEDRRTLGEKTIEGAEPTRWKKRTGRFKVSNSGLKKGQPLIFSISLSKPSTVLLDHCYLFPADNINGFDPDVVRLLKESNLTLLRYPGGNFASQYNWEDGIGPIETRPIRLNKAWNMVEYNHVGTDEFMRFCSLVECEPLICINAGDGKPEDAAQWVEYCNSDINTTYGKLRAENGNPEPYQVKFWEIGNELYGRWQIGYCSAEEYAERYERFYDSMIKVDPRIRFIANGYDLDWNKKLVDRKGRIIHSLSIHPLIGGRVPRETPSDDIYHGIIGFTYWFATHLKKLRDVMSEKVKDPRIAITELQTFTGYQGTPSNRTLTEALYYSGIVNAAIQHEDFVELITHSALVNHGGGLKKRREIVYADPVYYARTLYAKWCARRVPVKVIIETPMFEAPELPGLPAVKDVPYVDAVALVDEHRKDLSLIVSNRKPDEPAEAKIHLHDYEADEKAKIETLKASSYMAENSWENPDLVKIVEAEATISDEELEYAFPPHSITVLLFESHR